MMQTRKYNVNFYILYNMKCLAFLKIIIEHIFNWANKYKNYYNTLHIITKLSCFY